MILEEFETLRDLPAAAPMRIWGLTERCGSVMERIAVAFAALAAKQCTAPYFDDLDRLLDQIAGAEPVRRALEQLLRPKDLPLVKRLSKDYEADDLKAFVLFRSREACKGASSFSELSALFLDSDERQSVADLCCGDGTFIVDAFPALGKRAVAAFEKNREMAAAAALRSCILGPNYRVFCKNAVTTPGDARYDRVFVRPSEEDQKARIGFFAGPAKLDSDMDLPPSTTMSAVWALAGAAVDILKPEGKAVVCIPAGALAQRVDSAIRSSYIRSGLIESVIMLPESLMQTAVPSAVIVLSRNNETVRMVDARGASICRNRSRAEQTLSAPIADLIEAEGTCSVEVSKEQLAEADWTLLPKRYLNERTIPDGRPLEEICTRIERGAQISGNKIDELRADVPTQCRLLRIADIEDGIVYTSSSAEFLTELPETAKRRCLKDGTLVLCRQGSPTYKSGVAQTAANEQVLAPGNVYLIDVDQEIADPYFLQAFLQSEAGTASLRKLGGASQAGAIALSDLRKLVVPVPPLEIQRRVGEAYRETSMQCAKLRRELTYTRTRLQNVFDTSIGADDVKS